MIGKLDLPLLAEADVVVVGGGPAGVGAALAAARHGVDVLLVEQFNVLGGLGTAGMVPMFAPVSDGARRIYGGVFEEINLEMCRRMKIEPWQEYWQSINPEILKRILDEKIVEVGVKLIFGVKVCEAEVADGRVGAVLAATSQGLKRITGKLFIDATGDALLAKLAGASFSYGDDNGLTMSPTLCAQFANIDYEAVNRAAAAGITDRKIWARMTEEGTAPFAERHFVCMKPQGRAMAASNLGHIYGLNCLDELELTRGYLEGRQLLVLIEKFYREHIPGFEHVDLIASASLLGVRESRRIDGEYQLSFADYEKRAEFDDGVGRCSYPVDIHSSSSDPAEQLRVEEVIRRTTYHKGESYAIPYRSLIPKRLLNVLVPGRSLSSDRAIQSSLRVMPPCFVTGQAAGVAASLFDGNDVRTVDSAALRERLAAMGATL